MTTPPPPPPPGEPGGYPPPEEPGRYPPPADQPTYGYPPPDAPGWAAPPPAPPYGGPPPPGYGVPPGYGAVPLATRYATWGQRASSGFIDFFGPSLVASGFYSVSRPLSWLLTLAALAWALYNAYLGGSTGQSYGKRIAGTRLIAERTGQPLGGGLGIVRYFVHILDSLPCYLGFLWPLWDRKRQTFADKIMSTVVVTV